ncbi:MAG: DUF4347 domain-containing protein, partial [Gammaproteobacteria bacterium]|nr:DUF4347 domain-containing protein [Gammaproteobacteria bacterium]
MAKKIRFQRLEPRILLDAAAGFTLAETTLDDKTDSLVGVQQSSPEPDLQNSETFGYGLAETENNGVILGEVEQTALVVVDTSIDGYESLLTNIDSGTEILLIEGNENGLEVIANYVDGRSDISSIHILSHGDEGSFRLGTATVNAQNIDLYAEALSQIGDSLTEEGDLFFYGCNISGGETGIEFVTELAFYTDADVAASIDLTGAEAEGGDWDLETTIGQLDTESLTFSDFAALLPQDNQDPALLEIVPQDNGNELTLVIDEDNSLDDTIAVPTTAFIVTVNSNAATVSSVSVDATNNTVTLTLADPVSIDDAVVVDYTQQAGLQIQDTAGKFLPSFSSVSMSASPIYFSSDVWTVVAPSGTTQYDYVVDQQTGQAGGDIVGNENESGFYTYFDDNGTGSNTDGDLSLRWRVGAEGNSYYFAGLDANLDGAVDVFLTVTSQGDVAIWGNNPSALNISPSTTGIDSTYVPYVVDGNVANFAKIPVTSVESGATPDIDGAGDPDYYVNLTIPFQELVDALAGLPSPITITDASAVRWVAATATQGNTFNQDIAGLEGNNSADITYAASGTFSNPVDATGTVVTPAGAPQLNDLQGDTAEFIKGGAAVIIDQDVPVTITDADDAVLEDANSDLDGGIRIFIEGGTPVEDLLGIDTSGVVSVDTFAAGGIISVNGTAVGTITNVPTSTLSLLTITFDQEVSGVSGATLANVNEILQAVTYENTNTTAPDLTDRGVFFFVSDGSLS